MGIRKTIHDIEVLCPRCNSINEIDYLDISITISDIDVSRRKNEGVSEIECSECKANLVIFAQLDIDVVSTLSPKVEKLCNVKIK